MKLSDRIAKYQSDLSKKTENIPRVAGFGSICSALRSPFPIRTP